jgi:hypothetical protein
LNNRNDEETFVKRNFFKFFDKFIPFKKVGGIEKI